MVTKQLGLILKREREKIGLSQEKFALKIGMDRTYYASVEKGNRNISINNLKKIADGFNLTLSQLFKGIK